MTFLNVEIFPRLALTVVCRDIDQFIDDFLVPLKIAEPGSTCFSSSSKLPFGFFVLALTAILSAISVELTNSVSLAAVEDRRAALQAYKLGKKGPPEPILVERNLGILSALLKRRPRWLVKLALLKSSKKRRRGQRNGSQPRRNGSSPPPPRTTGPPPGAESPPLESHYVPKAAPRTTRVRYSL